MSESIEHKSPRPILDFLIKAGVTCFFIALFALMAIPNFVDRGRNTPGGKSNRCINNLRQIDAAKNEWAMEHDAKSNDVVTINDIRPYIERERNNPYI